MNKTSVVIDEPLRNIEGVNNQTADRITEMLKKGRRYFGSSGAGMTQQASNPANRENENFKVEQAKEYLEGERDTTTFLKNWLKDKPNVILIDSVSIPDWEEPEEFSEGFGFTPPADTDHVMLIGDDVILIDTQRWKKKKNYSVHDDGTALMTNKQFPEGEILMNKSIHSWLEYLDEDATLTGIVCINTEEATVLRNRNWYTQNYRLVELDRFEELLNEKWKMVDEDDKNRINSTLVSQVVVRCIKPFDEYSKVFLNMKTLQDFK